MRLKLERAEWITPTSHYEASRLTSRYGANPAKLRLLYIGVPQARARSHPKQHSASESFKILSVGTLQEKKGHEYLIRAVAHLVGRGIAAQCTIVGGGPLAESLSQLVRELGLAEHVSLVGWLPSENIVSLTLEADVFCLACVTSPTSGTDGIPFALMEAMQLRVPCISTWTAGIPELIIPGVTGLLVPPADPEALAIALEILSSDHELRSRLGQQGATHVAEYFDLTVNVAKLARLLRCGTTAGP
jgi:glycosyltransferase involved in cell wall biosynthesis